VPGPAAVGSPRAAVLFSVECGTDISLGGIGSTSSSPPAAGENRPGGRPAPSGRGGKSPSMSKAYGRGVPVAAKEPRRRAAMQAPARR
jgi:hypothetical protein